MSEKEVPIKEGHSREWQDRARVVLDVKKAAQKEASPNQSPATNEDIDDVEEKSIKTGKYNEAGNDPAY